MKVEDIIKIINSDLKDYNTKLVLHKTINDTKFGLYKEYEFMLWKVSLKKKELVLSDKRVIKNSSDESFDKEANLFMVSSILKYLYTHNIEDLYVREVE